MLTLGAVPVFVAVFAKSSTKLELVVESELYLTAKAVGGAEVAEHLPEGGRVDVLISDREIRMIENVRDFHAEFDGVTFGDMGKLLNTGVQVECPGSVEHSAL